MADGTYGDESPDASIGERVSNSVKKIVSDVAQLSAPRSVAARKANVDDQLAESVGGDDKVGRMKAAQSTDRDNSYSYAWPLLILAAPLAHQALSFLR